MFRRGGRNFTGFVFGSTGQERFHAVWHKTLSLLCQCQSLHHHFLLSGAQAEDRCHEIAKLPSKMAVQTFSIPLAIPIPTPSAMGPASATSRESGSTCHYGRTAVITPAWLCSRGLSVCLANKSWICAPEQSLPTQWPSGSKQVCSNELAEDEWDPDLSRDISLLSSHCFREARL